MILRKLGVYGWDGIERFLIASVVGRFPTLVVGGAGTGKTEGLERMFMALERAAELKGEAPRTWGYRNASTAQIEDMTGFPLLPPMDMAWKLHEEGKTPRMLWIDSPETVRYFKYLVADEINRIPPMVQNRWFTLIAERRIDSMDTDIESLFALMNPVEGYDGTEPLDGAFADRFVWLVNAPSFYDMSLNDQAAIASTRLKYREGRLRFGAEIPDDVCIELDDLVIAARQEMEAIESQAGGSLGLYAATVARLLKEKSIESRRVAMISQGISALQAVTSVINKKSLLEDTALESLRMSFVHRAMGRKPPQDQLIVAAHDQAKHYLQSALQTLRSQLDRITDVVSRVGFCLSADVDQETLSNEMQAAHNKLIATDPVVADGFSLVMLSMLNACPVEPYKYVVDELAASVLSLFSYAVDLPSISVVPGATVDTHEVTNVIRRAAQLRESSTGRAVLLMAGKIYASHSPSATRTKTSASVRAANPMVEEYRKYGQAIMSAESVLREIMIKVKHYE